MKWKTLTQFLLLNLTASLAFAVSKAPNALFIFTDDHAPMPSESKFPSSHQPL